MPSPDPLVVSAFFLRPALPGPAEVRTAIVRSGRRIATGEATLYQDGKRTLRVTAAFSDLAARRRPHRPARGPARAAAARMRPST